jgi:membrane fusion protein, heavy metal efflux system
MLSACDKGTSADDHDDRDAAVDSHDGEGSGVEEQHDEEEQAVELTPAELDEFGIEIATAGSRSVEVTVDLPGEVVMNPDGVAHVVARASGIVLEVYKTIGDPVAAGEALAVLESPALAQAKADYLSRSREYELARTDLARAETVFENTRKLLEFLGDSPSLDALRAFSNLDLGENRRVLVSTYAQLVASEAVYAREQSLFEKEIGSEAEYLEAESEFKQAQAAFLSVRDDLAFTNARTLDQRRREAKVAEVALLAAERNLHALGISESAIASVAEQADEELARYVISSPLDGVVTERHIVRGEQMEQGDDIYTVADLSTVWVHLTVYQKDLPVLRSGQSAEIVAHHGIGEAQGTIQYVSPVISESTRTTTARIVLDNPEGAWRPGLFVTGRVVTETFEPRVAVPIAAVQSVNDEQIVFVRTELGFEPKPVELGRGNGTHVEIVKGLNPGDAYVAAGGFALKAELNKASFEGGGHAH